MVSRKRHHYAGISAGATGHAIGSYLGGKLRGHISKKLKTAKMTRQGGGSSRTITRQKDSSQRKSGKRMSARKKKWTKFVKNVKAATNYSDTLQSYTEAPSAAQPVGSILGTTRQMTLATLQANRNRDLRLGIYNETDRGLYQWITSLITEPSAATAGGVTNVFDRSATQNDLCCYVNSQVCTISLKNTSDLPRGVYVGGGGHPIYIDIYECVAKTDITDPLHGTAYNSWINCLANTEPPQALVPGWTPNIVTFTGNTPLNAPNWGKYWKLIKTTRVLVQINDKINYTYWGYKGKVTFAKMASKLAVKGKTKDLIVVVNPTYNGDTILGQVCIEVEWSRNTNCRMPEVPGIQTSFNGFYSYA